MLFTEATSNLNLREGAVLMEIVEGIYRVNEASSNLAHSNICLVVNGIELLVVDTGTAGNVNKISRGILTCLLATLQGQ